MQTKFTVVCVRERKVERPTETAILKLVQWLLVIAPTIGGVLVLPGDQPELSNSFCMSDS